MSAGTAQLAQQMVKLAIAHNTENRMPVIICSAIVPPFQRARRIPQPTPENALPYMLIKITSFNMKGVSQMVMAGMDKMSQKANHPNLRGGFALAESFCGAEKFLPQNGHHGAEYSSTIFSWQCGQFIFAVQTDLHRSGFSK
jgi:hypothetical protein